MKKRFPKPTAQRQRLWSVIRQLRRFAMSDVVAASECSEAFVSDRLKVWARYGVVRRDNDGWRLARDLGPLAPGGGTKAPLFDRNSGKELERLPQEERPRRKCPAVAEANRRRRHPDPVKAATVRRTRIWLDPRKSAERAALIGKERRS